MTKDVEWLIAGEKGFSNIWKAEARLASHAA
jgi:hypothetical protein